MSCNTVVIFGGNQASFTFVIVILEWQVALSRKSNSFRFPFFILALNPFNHSSNIEAVIQDVLLLCKSQVSFTILKHLGFTVFPVTRFFSNFPIKSPHNNNMSFLGHSVLNTLHYSHLTTKNFVGNAKKKVK